VLDLLEWVGNGRRTYAETMEVWRTSCPRLPIWEEANARGFLTQVYEPEAGTFVSVSAKGLEYLRRRRSTTSTAA